MWELDHKEGCMPKNWCFWTVVLEKTLESPLDGKEIKPVNPKGNQPWIFIGRTDAEAEAPILWPLDVKSQLIGKDPDAGKDWRQEVKEDEMVGWHHWLNRHEFEQAPGDGEGQRGLACCSPWGRKELDTAEWINNNKSQPSENMLVWANKPPLILTSYKHTCSPSRTTAQEHGIPIGSGFWRSPWCPARPLPHQSGEHTLPWLCSPLPIPLSEPCISTGVDPVLMFPFCWQHALTQATCRL